MYKTTLIIAFILGNVVAHSQISPIPGSVTETWHEKVPVSGEIRTGLMIGTQCSDRVKNNFYVVLPEEEYKYLSVEISSNDGRYNSYARYNVTGFSGSQNLIRESERDKELKNYKCEDLTILSWVSNSEGEEKENFVLSNWVNPTNAETVIVFLNSENKALIHIKDKSTGSANNVECTTILQKPNVAYNCKCEVPLSFFSGDKEVSIVQRVRRSQNRYPLEIKL